MQGEFHTAKDKDQLKVLHTAVDDYYQEHGRVQAQIVGGSIRTLEQNDKIHKLYRKASKKLGDQTVEDIMCECKLTIGVPILRAESNEFREQYDRRFKGRFSYEEKLELMTGLCKFPVTSIMDTAQLSRYIDRVIIKYGLEV